MIEFSLDTAMVVQTVLTVFMPIIVGLITTKTTAGAVKSWLLAGTTLATSILTGFAEAMSSGMAFDLGVALLMAIPAFAISVSTHYGLWKPTGVSTKAQEVSATTLVH